MNGHVTDLTVSKKPCCTCKWDMFQQTRFEYERAHATEHKSTANFDTLPNVLGEISFDIHTFIQVGDTLIHIPLVSFFKPVDIYSLF